MARKTTKTSKKASISFNWDNNSKKKKSNKAKKELKKLGFLTIVVALLLMSIGVGVGSLVVKISTKNDCFNLIGKDEITLQLGETYVDEGVNIISFGKDVSEDITIETNLKVDVDGKYYAENEGTYYMIYKSNNFKYGTIFKVQKIRLITFVEQAEQDEINSTIEGGNS